MCKTGGSDSDTYCARKENPVLSGFRTMARYNRWMNERVYERCEKLPDAERKADRGAFFRSIHGTLNHLLLGDRLWLSRFLSREFRVSTLADELYADFAELRRERAKTDAEILEWVETLDESCSRPWTKAASACHSSSAAWWAAATGV